MAAAPNVSLLQLFTGGQIISQQAGTRIRSEVAPKLYQIKSNQFISEMADSRIELQDNDNVQPLTEVR